jgi:hypothetical protein
MEEAITKPRLLIVKPKEKVAEKTLIHLVLENAHRSINLLTNKELITKMNKLNFTDSLAEYLGILKIEKDPYFGEIKQVEDPLVYDTLIDYGVLVSLAMITLEFSFLEYRYGIRKGEIFKMFVRLLLEIENEEDMKKIRYELKECLRERKAPPLLYFFVFANEEHIERMFPALWGLYIIVKEKKSTRSTRAIVKGLMSEVSDVLALIKQDTLKEINK